MLVILQNIRSLHNVGSIFRTADAAGIEKLYLCGITPTPLDRFGKIEPKLAKVSLGAEKAVAWEKVISASALIGRLKKEGYQIWAVEQARGSVPYYRKVILRGVYPDRSVGAQNDKKIILVFGNEVRGLSPAILRKCDKILEIPMRGEKESLNVAVAFGIVTFHLIYG